jgi:pyruvate dehydrogenase E2 component (dihydrolipoamide acetyltransferase)
MAALEEVRVPDIGDFSDLPVIEIFVSPGDTVAEEDPLVTIESDKATMDIPAPAAGVVQELKVGVGDTVSEGSVLLVLEIGGDGGRAGEAAEEPPAEATAQVQDPAADPLAAPAPDDGPRANSAPDISPPSAPAAPVERADGAPPYASPSVRRLARELGVDLAGVTGSGRKDRITAEDVRALAAGGGGTPSVPGGAGVGGLQLLPWPQVDFAKFGPIEVVALSRIKKISRDNLARNWVMIPHVTHHDEADITDLEAFRVQTNEVHRGEGVKLTMVSLLLKACVATLKQFPEFNASLDGDSVVLKRYYHLGFAVDTPQGLVVPVIRDVDQKGLLQIATELAELSAAARDGKLGMGDMVGGTFTISSLGGIGGTGFTPIINAPEVAILGVTRSQLRPVWTGEAFEPRLMLPLSLSYDHRVIDGAAAARFTYHLAQVLSDLRRGLL